MNVDNSPKSIAKKYARALLNVNGAHIQYDDVKRIEKIGSFIKDHPSISIFFKLFIIDDSVYKDNLFSTIKQLGFPDYMHPLIKLLIDSKRLFLLSDICKFIGVYFRKKHNIVEFLITTPQPLSTIHKEKINQFLSAYTQGSIEATYALDQTLIAGVRMQSKTHIWEKSIAQQLRDVQLKSMR